MSKCFNGLLLSTNIICTEKKIHFCKQDNSELFSLTKRGLTLGHLFAIILENILSIFFTPQIRGEAKAIKQLVSLDKIYGRLKFTWKTIVICD